MAIIPCRECAHQVSDQAASCPSCGVPIAAPVPVPLPPKPRPRHRLSTALITLMALWTLGTVLWLIVPRSASDEWIARARSSLQGFDRSIGLFPAGTHSNATARSHQAQATTAPVDVQPVAAAAPAPTQPTPPARPVYRTTAEQLYRAYDANVVATQNRIGGSLVRLTGSVTEIDQDATGRPVVKLSAGKDGIAAMTLADNQRVAAAQLHKGEAVDIECDQIGRSGAVLLGSGCSLSFVDERPREVNLALFLTNESGAAHVYVAGPMSDAVCRERGEQISSRLKGKQRGEYVVWSNCTEAARESIPPGTCRLNSSATTVPDVPNAQLWRYDCSAPNVARTTSHRKKTPDSIVVAEPEPAAKAIEGTQQASLSPASPGLAASLDVAQAAPAPTTQVVEHAPASNLRLASSVGGSDIGGATVKARVPAEDATVAHASSIPTPDELGKIRASDPQAAEHIATYCSKAVTSTNREALIAYCRRSEAEAYTRLVLQNEFPTLTEAVRKKCSEPPFPDTFVAKESCARYELRAN